MKAKARAAIYVRVSSREQATDDKVSLEVQQRECEAYCQRRGYEVAGPPYVDIQSGTDSRKERVRFEQMLIDVKRGRFDVIVAWRPDRLFRSLWPAARLKQVMDATGVEVETVTQPMDKTTLGLWAWVAEREIENIRERTRMGREAMARAGKMVTGNPPYGFKYDASIRGLRHDDTEKPQVLGMFSWVAQGKSIQSLVTSFNRLGILTRRGSPWTRQQVLKTLRNPIYMGKAHWGKTARRDGHLVARKTLEEQIVVPVEPIVTEATFQQVQRQLDSNRTESPRNTKQVYLLQHLLRCRGCGKPFIARSQVTRHGKPLKAPVGYYGCLGMKKSPGAYSCRRSAELRASSLEEAVWDKVAQAFAEPKALVEILKARAAASAQETDAVQAELTRAREELQRKQLELQHLLTWARQRLLTAEELRPQLAQVREQQEHWEQEVDRLGQKLESIHVADQDLSNAEQVCASVRDRLPLLTPQERKEFLALVVERVWVDAENNLDIEVVIPTFNKPLPPGGICETALSQRERGFPYPNPEAFSLEPGARSLPTSAEARPPWRGPRPASAVPYRRPQSGRPPPDAERESPAGYSQRSPSSPGAGCPHPGSR